MKSRSLPGEGIDLAGSFDNGHFCGIKFVNVNNHYEGSAPITIERFLESLRMTD